MNILDPIGVFRQHKKENVTASASKGVMKNVIPFKMKGYSYPGISPLKQFIKSDNPYDYMRTKRMPLESEETEKTDITTSTPYSESRAGKYQKKSLTVPSKEETKPYSSEKAKHGGEHKIDKSKKIKRSKPGHLSVKNRMILFGESAGRSIKQFAGSEAGTAVIGSVVTAAVTPKEKKASTRIIDENWKIM